MQFSFRNEFLLLPALLIGFLVGGIVPLSAPPPTLTVLQPDLRPIIPVVRIDGLTAGKLHGVVTGNARVFVSGTIISTASGGAFAVPAGKTFSVSPQSQAPSGVQVVASKRGSKYYPVQSTAGQKLSPANRIYFRSAQEAETAGYRRGE